MARKFLSAIKLLTGATPPAGTAGDTFFDTDTKTVQVHDGDAWVNSTVRATDGAIGGRVFTGDTTPTAPVTGDLWVDSTGFSSGANILRWRKTMSGGETSISSLDDLSTTLSYTVGYEEVFINGVLQVRAQDYVATTGTTITGFTAFSANDVVTVIAHQNMVYGDYYTQSQADARYYTKTSSASSGESSTVNINTKPWNMPWGTVSYHRNTSASLTLTGTTETDFMGGPSWTPIANRVYEITVTIGFVQKTTGVGNITIRLRKDSASGTVLDESLYSAQNAASIWIHTKTFLATTTQLGTSAFVPFVTAQTNTNGLSINNSASQPGAIIIKDIGPA
jgi:hypothetical protein